MLAVAVGYAALAAAGCTGPAPAAAPTAKQLLASAAAGLRGGLPCSVSGDIAMGTVEGVYDSVSSISSGDRFSDTMTLHLPRRTPLTIPERLIYDGAALYFQSAVALQIASRGPVPTGLAGRWIRFPPWPALSKDAYNAAYSQMTSTYPGAGGDALAHLAMDSAAVPYQGGSCGLLVAQLSASSHEASRVVSGM